jgi:hypothetical protein
MAQSISGIGASQGLGAMRWPQELTDDQKKQVATVLSDYDSSAVTASDAKAIFNAFKEAGINPAPGLRDAIKAAGFDADKLRSLAMPEDGQGQGAAPAAGPGGGRPPAGGPRGAGGRPPAGGAGGARSTTGTQSKTDSTSSTEEEDDEEDLSPLEELQKMLSEYDLSNLSEKDQDELMGKLSEAGLLDPGKLFDLSA